MPAPPPVPALPDAARLTTYAPVASAGPFQVGFALFGDSTDYTSWVQVFLNGVQVTSGWTLSSPSGSLTTLARPITDAQITFDAPITGALAIVGAQRPRRLAQLSDNSGVTARDFNQIITALVAMQREVWDLRSRLPLIPPDASSPLLPAKALRALQALGFDADGNFIALAGVPAGVVSAAMADVCAAPDHATALALLGGGSTLSIPIGQEAYWPGFVAPTKWLFEDGSAIARATYPELLDVLAPAFSCVVASGNTTVTGFASTAGFDAGWPVEGAAFAAGTTIQSVAGPNSIVLSQPPIDNAATARLFPYGNGNGLSTFNLPDAAGVTLAGLDLSQTRLPNGQFLNRLLGAATHTLASAEMPVHNHGITEPNGGAGHAHGANLQLANSINLSGGGFSSVAVAGGNAFNNANATTGIAINNAGGTLGVTQAHNNVQPTRTRRVIIYAGH